MLYNRPLYALAARPAPAGSNEAAPHAVSGGPGCTVTAVGAPPARVEE